MTSPVGLGYQRFLDGSFQRRDGGQIDVTTDLQHRDPVSGRRGAVLIASVPDNGRPPSRALGGMRRA